MRAEPSTNSGVSLWWARVRGQNPGQARRRHDLSALDGAEPPAGGGQDPRREGGDEEGEAGTEEDHERESDHQAEQHARGRDDRRGKHLARGGVAEEEDRSLESLVEQAPAGPTEHIAHRRRRGVAR